MPAANVELVGTWTANPDTKYVVEHYTENLDGTTWKLEATENKTGTTDTKAAYPAKTFTGFTYDETKTTWTGKTNTDTVPMIKGDGSLVIELYYTRNDYAVSYEYESAPDHATALPTDATYAYGATVTVAADATATGYTFEGWYTKDGALVTVDSDDKDFIMPAGAVVLYGKFTRDVDEDGIEVTKN